MSYEEFRREATAIHKAGVGRVASAPYPAGQKFPPGSRVKIADDLGPSMRHFPKGALATVRYTYAHAYGGDDVKSYCLDVDGAGSVSWYDECQLTLVPDDWPDVIDA